MSLLNRSGAAPFHPVELPGVEFCYDAERLANQPGDGAALASWLDCSGKGRTPTSVGGRDAVYVKSHASFAGRSAIDFQGTDALQATFGLTLAQPSFIIAVAKTDVIGGDTFVWDGSDGSNRHAFFFSSGNPKKETMHAGASLLAGGGSNHDTNPHVFSTLWNGASSQLWIDGTSSVIGNASTNGLAGITLGATTSGTSNFLDGQIAFLIGFNYIPATDVRRRLEAWLGQRHGITVV